MRRIEFLKDLKKTIENYTPATIFRLGFEHSYGLFCEHMWQLVRDTVWSEDSWYRNLRNDVSIKRKFRFTVSNNNLLPEDIKWEEEWNFVYQSSLEKGENSKNLLANVFKKTMLKRIDEEITKEELRDIVENIVKHNVELFPITVENGDWLREDYDEFGTRWDVMCAGGDNARMNDRHGWLISFCKCESDGEDDKVIYSLEFRFRFPDIDVDEEMYRNLFYNAYSSLPKPVLALVNKTIRNVLSKEVLEK